MARSLKNLFSFIFKVYLYVFEFADSKLTLLTVGSCQFAVKTLKYRRKLYRLAEIYVFEVAGSKSDLKFTFLIVGSCQLTFKQ